ncbi:MBL fold metallo-hydrolase [Pelomonas sp. SE-A7]|uniref:MBL fold metallo-hydrolase n=1 Tax=Pelomonas sp. SE-A7 TaxID=3054953 RepID=UPI00259CAF59|nr:MBL fold metallo-hydrolase [Pelomonas sp. SE-A7]MDM4767966.1 MBL fold metallo-hydrolase [Pelomonas sp. SE-A7]
MSDAATALLPDDVRILERGWLSSNSVLLRGDGSGAVLVDTGYCTHAEQTSALVRHALWGEPLRLIVNTHLHSDHCGGNARLAAEHGCAIWVPPGELAAIMAWDEERLSYRPTGQSCDRFAPERAFRPGEVLVQGGREWQVLAAPGHDPHSVILFEAVTGILVSADALWEHGFGIVFPELDGSRGFDEVAQTLDLIAALPVRLVIPGHGKAFVDAETALQEARSRLDFFRTHPERHTRHAAKALLVFHMLELQRCQRAELLAWLQATPIHVRMWQLHFADRPLPQWSEELLQELCQAKILQLEGGIVSVC